MMNHTQFYQNIKSHRFSACYLLEGEEEHIKKTMLEELKNAVLPKAMRELNEITYVNPTPDILEDATATYPVMADKRLVIVTECACLSAAVKETENNGDSTAKKSKSKGNDAAVYAQIIDALPPHTILIFYERGSVDRKKALYKKLESVGGVVTFAKLSEAELSKWIAQTLKAHGKVISAENAAYLHFYTGGGTALLRGEIEKLAAYAHDHQEITQDDIRAVCIKSEECVIFDLTDEIAMGRTAGAIRHVKYLLSAGDSKERGNLLYMILRQYRIMYHLTVMKRIGMNAWDWPLALGIHTYSAQVAEKQAAAYTEASLNEALNMLEGVYLSVRTGKLTQDNALENVILLLPRYLTQPDNAPA